MDLGSCLGVTLLTDVQASGHGGMNCEVFVSSDVKAGGLNGQSPQQHLVDRWELEDTSSVSEGEETQASIQGALGRDVGRAITVLREAGQRT